MASPRDCAAVDEARPAGVPGKRTLVDLDLAPWAARDRVHGEHAAPGRQTGVPVSGGAAALELDDFRVLGLRDVLGALRGAPALREATIASADRDVARRALPALRGPVKPAAGAAAPDAGGIAMWQVAERRAVTLYRRALDGGDAVPDDPRVAAALARAGGGAPLPAEARRKLEAELGVSLERVRIHSDAVAAGAAHAVSAAAFTVGEDIFFAQGAFDPGSPAGEALLAHELAHVVQGWQGRTGHGGSGLRVSCPDDSLEQEAAAVADRVSRGGRAGEALRLAAPGAATSTPGTGAPAHGDRTPARQPPAAPGGRTAGTLHRVAVPTDQARVDHAFSLAHLELLKAKINLRLAKVNAERARNSEAPIGIADGLAAAVTAAPQHVAARLGDATTLAAAIDLADRIDTQLQAVQARVTCYSGVGQPDPFETDPQSNAMNSGTGGEARIALRVPAFFQLPDPRKAHTLIHEASHGLVAGETRDIAYQHERLFRFLPELGLATQNADSVAAFVIAAASGQAPADQAPADHVENLTPGQALRPRIAMAQAGVAARAAVNLCGEIRRYLGVCIEHGTWVDDDEYAEGQNGIRKFFDLQVLPTGQRLDAYVGAFEALEERLIVIEQFASQGEMTFRRDDHIKTVVEWQKGGELLLAKPEAETFDLTGMTRLLIRQGLLAMGYDLPTALGLTVILDQELERELRGEPPEAEDPAEQGADRKDRDDEKSNKGDKGKDAPGPGSSDPPGQKKDDHGKGGPGAPPGGSGGLPPGMVVAQFKRPATAALPLEVPAPSGGGAPLPDELRAPMERSFGAEFGGVRVHDGPQAAALGAQAYTQGEDIHVRPGLDPRSAAYADLLGHELTHVMQQRAGRVAVPQGAGAPINADPDLEREADQLGARAARGEPVATTGAATAASGLGAPIQRRIEATAEFMQAQARSEALRVLLLSVDGVVRDFLLQVTDTDNFNVTIDVRDDIPVDKFAVTGIGWTGPDRVLHPLEIGTTTAQQIWTAASIDVQLVINTANPSMTDTAEVMENLAHELTLHIVPLARLMTARETAGSLEEFAQTVDQDDLLAEWGPLDEDQQHDELGKGRSATFHALIENMVEWLVEHDRGPTAERLRRAAAVDVARHRLEVLVVRSGEEELIRAMYDNEMDLHAIADDVLTEHPEFIDVLLEVLPEHPD